MLRRAREEQAAWARRATEVRSGLHSEIEAAAAARSFRRAWLIGSLAWDYWGRDSDVDLVVEGMTDEASSAWQTQLTGALGVHVDVLRLETLPDSFRERVLRDGVSLQ